MKEWFITLINNNGWDLLLAFLISQLANVILSTIKSILTIRGTRTTATLINVISYTLNAGVISVIGKVDDIIAVCIVTAVTNLIGVYFSLWVLDKLRKERLWRISCTVPKRYQKELTEDLNFKGLDFIIFESSWEKRFPIDIFSYSKEQSKAIRKVLKSYEGIKYTISIDQGEL